MEAAAARATSSCARNADGRGPARSPAPLRPALQHRVADPPTESPPRAPRSACPPAIWRTPQLQALAPGSRSPRSAPRRASS
eukprot:3177431-Alexandrium_andersonii.AAC.1